MVITNHQLELKVPDALPIGGAKDASSPGTLGGPESGWEFSRTMLNRYHRLGARKMAAKMGGGLGICYFSHV